MKKNFLFAAVALAVMTSCSNDEVVNVNNGDAISFRASLDKAISRGAETTVQNLGAFNVTAVVRGESKNYFTNLSVTSIDNGQTWNTASTYYWPSSVLQFFAYSPQTGVGTVNIETAQQKITEFSPELTVADQKDLVIAYNTGNRAANENSGVPLNFKHALSQIAIKAKCLNPNIKIEVKGVRIMNAAKKADFTFPNAVTTAEYSLPKTQWDNLQGANLGDGYMIKGESSVVLTKDAQSIMFGENNFMLIPQKLTAWENNTQTTGAYLSILCRIYNVDGNDELLLYPEPGMSAKDGKYAYSAVAIDTDWLPGKKYTYTLTFCGEGGGAGRIDPNPETDNPNVDPNPIPGKEKGDLILGAPIKFTVTVDNWAEESKDIKMD